jgi:hypothetical protein
MEQIWHQVIELIQSKPVSHTHHVLHNAQQAQGREGGRHLGPMALGLRKMHRLQWKVAQTEHQPVVGFIG